MKGFSNDHEFLGYFFSFAFYNGSYTHTHTHTHTHESLFFLEQ
jgi:hypothetical protein